MNKNDLRELTASDLELVSGGADSNYKFCWDGPAGTGTYPNYVDCGPTWADIYESWAQRGRDLATQSNGGRPL